MNNFNCDFKTVVQCVPKTQPLQKAPYERPEQTFTDTLQTNEKMKEKLTNYVRVDDIEDVALSTHVRYVTLKDGAQRFCLGGLVSKIHPKYVVLTNGTFTWSVQRYHWENDENDDEPIFETVFFRILTTEEKQENIIKKQEEEIQKLKQFIQARLSDNT